MEYEEITDLEDISRKAIKKIGDQPYLINFDLRVTFAKSLVSSKMSDVYEDALNFQNQTCPSALHMNHGQYIHKVGNGIENVISQLKSKHASNRAIISLINQEDIMESKDNPIPSFMILQFSIEDATKLYVTTYFRALEVSKFLRINTEEIRQIIEKILSNFIRLKEVYLNIVAFRAYIDLDINPLKKPKIDLLKERQFLTYLKPEANLENLIGLLEEKKTSSTVIEYSSFNSILGWIEDKENSSLIHPNLKKQLVITLFKEIEHILIDLKALREQASHNSSINSKQAEYKAKIEQLVRVIRNDS